MQNVCQAVMLLCVARREQVDTSKCTPTSVDISGSAICYARFALLSAPFASSYFRGDERSCTSSQVFAMQGHEKILDLKQNDLSADSPSQSGHYGTRNREKGFSLACISASRVTEAFQPKSVSCPTHTLDPTNPKPQRFSGIGKT